jgi:hypothetical protein
MYNARDAPLREAWWHDTYLSTMLSDHDIVELIYWVKLCLGALQGKREKLGKELVEREKAMMYMRLPGQMAILSRYRAVRKVEAVKPKVKIDAKEMEVAQIGIRVKREVKKVSGVADDRTGVGGKKEKKKKKIGEGCLTRKKCWTAEI